MRQAIMLSSQELGRLRKGEMLEISLGDEVFLVGCHVDARQRKIDASMRKARAAIGKGKNGRKK
jgi:hypothetical protein